MPNRKRFPYCRLVNTGLGGGHGGAGKLMNNNQSRMISKSALAGELDSIPTTGGYGTGPGPLFARLEPGAPAG